MLDIWHLKIEEALMSFLNNFLHTDKIEYIDRADFPIQDKIKIIRGLDIKNQAFGTYRKIFRYLKPLVQKINQNEKRPFKILELAAGSGNLSIGLYQAFLADKNQLQVDITSSDIVKAYVDSAHESAKIKNLPIKFMVIDALDIDSIGSEKFDIVITLHSFHHFTPEQLKKLVQKSQNLATYGLFAVDGTKSLSNLFFMFLTALMPSLFTWNKMYIHDDVISGLKMYERRHLIKLAKEACPEANIVCEKLSLGLNYLRVLKRRT